MLEDGCREGILDLGSPAMLLGDCHQVYIPDDGILGGRNAELMNT